MDRLTDRQLAQVGSIDPDANPTERARPRPKPQPLADLTAGGNVEAGGFEKPKVPREFATDEVVDNFDAFFEAAKAARISPQLAWAFSQIFMAEGGLAQDESGSTAFAGITEGALQRAKDRLPPGALVVGEPRDLVQMDQLVLAYLGWIQDQSDGRYGSRDKVGSGLRAMQELDRATLTTVVDAMFVANDQPGGVHAIRNGVLDVISELDERARRDLDLEPMPEAASNPGATMRNLVRMAKAGLGSRLRARVTDWRVKAAESALRTGLIPRLRYMSFPDEP